MDFYTKTLFIPKDLYLNYFANSNNRFNIPINHNFPVNIHFNHHLTALPLNHQFPNLSYFNYYVLNFGCTFTKHW
jgi:hypothetical protein